MNWYSSRKKISQTYFDIGFSVLTKPKLWIWLKGRLSVADVEEKDDTHSLFSFLTSGGLSNFYKGRFGKKEGSKLVSVVKPSGVQGFTDIPEELINALYKEFGSDSKIIEINDSELF